KGILKLTGKANTQTEATANSGGPIEIDATQTTSPVAVSATTLDGTGNLGFISAGTSGVVAPGTAAALGILTSTGSTTPNGFPPGPAEGANFSNNGTL